LPKIVCSAKNAAVRRILVIQWKHHKE
jgi:hypothetical protein